MYTSERKLREIYEYVQFHMNAYQRGTSEEENFNNQVDRMIHPAALSQSLSPAPCIAQWAHVQSSHSGRDGGCAWAWQHGLPFTRAILAMATVECPVFQEQRPALRP